MEPSIILPFSEFMVINELEKIFTKQYGYSITIPSTRQQKGFDIAIYNSFTKKILTFQIKGSRSYSGNPIETEKKIRYKYYSWFGSFIPYVGAADYYILFQLYIKPTENKSSRTKLSNRNWFDYKLLLFSETEMIDFLNKLVQKKTDKKDSMFVFNFDDSDIILTRGSKVDQSYSEFLLEKRIQLIENELNPNKIKYAKRKNTNGISIIK